MLLAGIGHVTAAPDSTKNFLVVDGKTSAADIEAAFEDFTTRKDIGILLINQHVSGHGRGRRRGALLIRWVVGRGEDKIQVGSVHGGIPGGAGDSE